MPTYYAILGLHPRKFDPAHLKKQYRALALRWHPDRNRGNEEAAAEKFNEDTLVIFPPAYKSPAVVFTILATLELLLPVALGLLTMVKVALS